MNGENRIWMALFVLGGVALLGRSLVTEFGKAYVREETVYVTGEGEDAAVAVDDGTIEGFVPDPEAVSWKRYQPVDPRDRKLNNVRFSWSLTIGLWVAALCTLAVISFLFGDNPAYRLAEAVFVGVSAAYAMIVGFWEGIVVLLVQKLLPIAVKQHLNPGLKLEGEAQTAWEGFQSNEVSYLAGEYAATNLLYVVPLVFGGMLLMRLSPTGGWISRWPLAFFIGATAGLRLIVHFESDFVRQIQATLLPLIVFNEDGSFSVAQSLANLTIVVGVLSSLAYFFFSVEHQGAFGGVSRLGIWFLMVTFGASFGYTVMGRITLFAQRLEYLYDDWLWLIDPLGRRVGL